MPRYLAGRILQAIVSMLVVSVVVFVLARLTGDPLEIMMPAAATKEDIAVMRAYLGLDRPWPVQYWRFISRAIQGDFGRSVRFNRPALEVVTNGSIIVETVFSWPGLGLLIIEAVQYRDYPVVQTVVLCLSCMYIAANLLVDVLYAYLNPRIRYSA